MNELTAIDLTPESFAPFGKVLVQPAREPDIPPSEDQEAGYTLEYWDRVVPYGEAIVSPNLGIIRFDGRPADGLVYTSVEIIPDATETYFPLSDFDAVLLVAHGSLYEPDLDTLTAFRLGRQPVQVSAGVWHQHPLPIGKGSQFDYGLFTSHGVIVREPSTTSGGTRPWNVNVDGSQVLTVTLPEPVRIVVS